MDASDVDLAVTGLRLMDLDSQLRQMARLSRNLVESCPKELLLQCDFIRTASVPVIKLVCDL